MNLATATKRWRKAILLFATAAAISGITSCDIPVLESAKCREAKNFVREFYSFHVGNDTHAGQEGIELRKRFLTPELTDQVVASSDGQFDYFTQTDSEPPRAFQVGSCTSEGPDVAIVQVLLFWRDDKRTEQRSINVEAIHAGEQWLVNKVSKN